MRVVLAALVVLAELAVLVVVLPPPPLEVQTQLTQQDIDRTPTEPHRVFSDIGWIMRIGSKPVRLAIYFVLLLCIV